MQYAKPSCQLPHARTGDSRLISHPSGGIPCQQNGTESPVWVPVRGAGQEIEHTASRRTGPRRWLRVVTWLIGAGLHQGANATTQRVAADLAARMDFTTGHARYCLDEMVARLGISRATIKRHIAVLRELGALVWAVHGTRANVRRMLGLQGYAGTATVYAATIPPVYDAAMGHRVIGSGYTARAITQRPTGAVDNPPVDNPGSQTCEPPSLSLVKGEGQVQVVGSSTDTTRKRARRTESPSTSTHTTSSNSGGARRRSPAQVAREIQETRLIRALVNWTQGERRLRRLAHVLRPLFDRGLTAHQIADELTGMCLGWRPKHPAAYIHTVLTRDAAAQRALKDADQTDGPFTEDGDWAAPHLAALPLGPAVENGDPIAEGDLDVMPTGAELEQMRLDGRRNPELVRAWIATDGEASARILYGDEIVRLALLATSTSMRLDPWMDATYA
ncbi:cell wall protein [Streptomyces gardneri]|uniref:cell wall protein n=1 Tax=Streptomyces gardneri TaxID=66892 RepID=UPI0035D58D4D